MLYYEENAFSYRLSVTGGFAAPGSHPDIAERR